MKQFTLEEKNQVLENPFIHIHRKLDVLLNIGKLLMECGANTNRIIEEMLKAATFMGIPHDYLNIHISYTTYGQSITQRTIHNGLQKNTGSYSEYGYDQCRIKAHMARL